ncbi:MAG: hypothetical protein CL912_14355 [Deltaproteobacteria bacterium]|nr:hypothetical protein [Deltaproteobacteria bacterium]
MRFGFAVTAPALISMPLSSFPMGYYPPMVPSQDQANIIFQGPITMILTLRPWIRNYSNPLSSRYDSAHARLRSLVPRGKSYQPWLAAK